MAGTVGEGAPTSTASALSLVELLTVAQRRVARGLAQALAEEGCTLDQWRVMRALADGQGHLMGELAEALQIPQPTLTRLMDGLVDSSQVYRRQAGGDRRKVAVHLSRKGQARLVRLDALVQAHEAALTARGRDAWQVVRRALDGLVRAD